MKIYVAGIRFAGKYASKSTAFKTRKLIAMLKDVMIDANQVYGENCLVVVALHEYALVEAAIAVEEKDASLATLQACMRNYPNLILIPGSYAVTQRLVDNERGRRKQYKITQTYSGLFAHSEYSTDKQFLEEKAAYQLYLDTGRIDKKIILQNSAYVLTANEKVKHKKSFPYDERDKLLGKHKGVLAIGDVCPVKKISAGGYELLLGIVVCREHLSQVNIGELKKNPPFIEVVISDSVNIETENLYGALNIHMDSFSGLEIYLNSGHKCVGFIEAVTGKDYIIDRRSVMKISIDKPNIFTSSVNATLPVILANDIYEPDDAADTAPLLQSTDKDLLFDGCSIN